MRQVRLHAGQTDTDAAALALTANVESVVAMAVKAAVAASTCPGSPALPFEVCGGINGGTDFAFSRAGCCTAGYRCMRKNVYYAQCRPVTRPAPSTWDGTILPCTAS